MRIQRNRGSPSAMAAPFALSPNRQRRAAPHPGHRRAADLYRSCLLAFMGSPMHVWPGRGLALPSRKGAGVWLHT
jgi:hypothetical protein